jgi:hypothetical protein
VVRQATRKDHGNAGGSMIDPVEQRRRILRFARSLDRGDQPTTEQVVWLTQVLRDIGEGRDANEALGLKGGRGKKRGDAVSRERMSVALHLVAQLREEGVDHENAFEQGTKYLRQLHGLAPDDRDERYSVETVRSYWNRNKHLQSAIRQTGEKDFPYRGKTEIT